MINSALILEAASMIREFDPATADVFLNRPFNRLALAEAFDAGFKTHSALILRICAFVILAAKRDVLDRRLAA